MTEVYVVAHPSSDPFILAEADQTFTYLSNGDDAFTDIGSATANSYTIIDIIGDLGPDVGSLDCRNYKWNPKSHLVRKKSFAQVILLS